MKKKVSLTKIINRFINRSGQRNDIMSPEQNTELWGKKGVQIGENTLIYPNVFLGRNGRDPIIIGRNCVLTGCTVIGHDASTNKQLGLKRSMIQPVIIEDDCFIGFQSIILMGVRIGKGSIVGAGAVVSKDVPADSVVVGNPAQVIGKVQDLIDRRKELMKIHPEFFPVDTDQNN